MYNPAYNAYKKASVKTASQAELVVLLYEGAVKKLESASSKFGPDGKLPVASIESFSADVLRAEEIITELQVSLDMEKGGEIARNLMSLYLYFNDQLRSANISKNKEKIDSDELKEDDFINNMGGNYVTINGDSGNDRILNYIFSFLKI